MIQPLRTVHRGAFIALAVVLPTVLVVGLRVRHPQPTTHAAETPASARPLTKSGGLWRKYAIQSEFYQDASNPQTIHVVLEPPASLLEPDLLLYWAHAEPQSDALPAHARLLGAFAHGKAIALPPEAADGGHLILYSQAHNAVVDTATLEKLP